MAKIHLTSFIHAPIERVFDLSRSINLHQISTASTNEKAIDGVMNGLINKNETVTWQAKHLFKTRMFTTKITEFESPYGTIGKIANSVFLKSYLEKLLINRNAVIKDYAETTKWKAILN